MQGSVKETVIIVHGTRAAPEPGRSRWYQAIPGNPAAQPFTAKLDTALQGRGSPARCWAHCGQGNQIFQWSGENSWIARTRAASSLGDYVAKLRSDGWQCHIIAHSHGGNIVVEALPKIMTAPSANTPLGKIVTLGTPFMNTEPVILKQEWGAKVIKFSSWCALALLILFVVLWLGGSWLGHSLEEVIRVWKILGWSILWSACLLGLWFLRRHRRRGRSELWTALEGAQIKSRFLAIGSLMDEAWQILYHMQNSCDPLAVKTNWFRYLFAVLRSHISQKYEVSLIQGAKSFRDLRHMEKLAAGSLHVIFHTLLIAIVGRVIYMFWSSSEPELIIYTLVFFAMVPFAAYFLILLFIPIFGNTFHSAVLSPYRRYARLVGSLGSVLPAFVTYIVRRRGWSVLLAMAMGLEGYRYRVPKVEQYPSYIPHFVKYENMPEAAEQRALAMRIAWINRHFGDVAQTFSRMVVTTADITSLLREVEADQSLVHAAYYTDEECIARVADWIAGRDGLPPHAS